MIVFICITMYSYCFNGFECLLGVTLLFYGLMTFLNSFCCIKVFNISFSIIVIFCAYEVILGILQSLNICESNNLFYTITGSFYNPGPYGGFLAICLTTICPYLLNTKNCVTKKGLLKLLNLLIICTIIIVISSQSRAAFLSLSVSFAFLCYKSGYYKRICGIQKKSIWITVVLVSFFSMAYYVKKPSADGRFFIDKICFKVLISNGLKGPGEMGCFGGRYGDLQACYFKDQILKRGETDMDWKSLNEKSRLTADCPIDAYNDYLFIGIEKGLLCMIFFILIVIVPIYISFKNDTIWGYGLITFSIFAFFSYPLKVIQFHLLVPVLIVSSLLDKSNETKINTRESLHISNRMNLTNSLITTLLTMLLIVYLLVVKVPVYKQLVWAYSEWNKIEIWYKTEQYEYVADNSISLLPYMKHDRHYLFAYGQSLNKIGNYSKSDSILSLGTKISSDPMFWNVMGNNSLAQGKYHEAEDRYKHAFYMVPNRLYPLYLLAKLYHTEGDTVKFLDMADKVETFIPKVESVNTERLRNEIRELKSGYISEQYE